MDAKIFPRFAQCKCGTRGSLASILIAILAHRACRRTATAHAICLRIRELISTCRGWAGTYENECMQNVYFANKCHAPSISSLFPAQTTMQNFVQETRSGVPMARNWRSKRTPKCSIFRIGRPRCVQRANRAGRKVGKSEITDIYTREREFELKLHSGESVRIGRQDFPTFCAMQMRDAR